MAGAGREVDDDQARTAVFARQDREMAFQQHGVDQVAAVAARDDVAPVRLGGVGARRLDDAEVARRGVGADDETLAVVEDVVEAPGLARGDEARGQGRRVEVDDMGLRPVVAVDVDHRGPPVQRSRYADEPGRIGLGVDLDVVALAGPEPMQHHPERPMALVLLDIEEGRGVARPDDVVARVDDAVVAVVAGREVPDPDGQQLRAEVVGGPGELCVIGRMARRLEAEERLAGGQGVAVEQRLFRAAVARPAADGAVLPAGPVARVIGPGPVRPRRLAVVLLKPRPHFGGERPLKIGGRRQDRLGVGVLRFEQGADVGGERVGVAQNLLPVVRPNPGEFVGPTDAVGGLFQGARLGAGRGGLGHGAVLARPRRSGKPGERGRNVGRAGAEEGGAGGAQFGLAAVAPERADRRNAVPARADHVVLAVAPHDAGPGREPLFGEDVGDEVALVVEPAVEFGAVGGVETAAEIEALEDADRVDAGLRGAQHEARAGGGQRVQRLRDAVVDGSLEQPGGAVARAIDFERRLGLLGAAEPVGEGAPERRADDPRQVLGRRRRAPHRGERVAKAADDALGRVGQRPVEVDEQGLSPGFGQRRLRSQIRGSARRAGPAAVDRIAQSA